jgi:glucose/arabinose dehydrogenase
MLLDDMKTKLYLCYTFFVAMLLLLHSMFAKAQTYPAGFNQTLVVSGLSDPTAIAFAPVSDGRIFVTQQGGALRVIKNGVLLSTPAVQIPVDDDGERGLLGVALDPGFTTNNYIYLYYTMISPARNRIIRFTMDGDVVASGSEMIVLDLNNLSSATNHNGGAMAFAPDGTLYVGVGENATGSNAQDLDNYLGKILRINSDGSVPAGNPFTTGSASRQRIWAYGLRNPYTIDFQPGTGTLYVNDVGETTWEEINDATLPGLNFGWPSAEGNSTNVLYTNPVFAYGHGDGDGVGCAITGGTFFNPSSTNYPAEYEGSYFYMDLCENWINYITPGVLPSANSFATGIAEDPLALKTGPDGNLYFLSRGSSSLYKITYSGSTPLEPKKPEAIVAIYPQPANEVLHVDLKTPYMNDPVTVVDLLGNTSTAPHTADGNKLSVNVSSLPAGLYMLRIGNTEKATTQQISVIR